MTAVRHSPLELACHVPSAVDEPPLPPCPSMCHQPLELSSKLNPWRWKVQPGCGWFAWISLLSPAPAWTLMSPLLPGGLLARAVPPAWARSMRPTITPRTPLALRIRVVPFLRS